MTGDKIWLQSDVNNTIQGNSKVPLNKKKYKCYYKYNVLI